MLHCVPLPASPSDPLRWRDRLIRDLLEQGWCHLPGWLRPSQVQILQQRLDGLLTEDALCRAGIGRGDEHQLASDIRRDRIHWLSRSSLPEIRYLRRMERLRLWLNSQLFLGLFEYEAHFAHYPPGAFYRKHKDSFQGAANRILSVVSYLENDWQPGAGGELLLYHPLTEEPWQRIPPLPGSTVIFLSESIPHEVLCTRIPRHSIAGWFRLNSNQGQRLDPPA